MITHSHLKKFSKLELERRQQTVKINVNMDTQVTAENIAYKLVDAYTNVGLPKTDINSPLLFSRCHLGYICCF